LPAPPRGPAIPDARLAKPGECIPSGVRSDYPLIFTATDGFPPCCAGRSICPRSSQKGGRTLTARLVPSNLRAISLRQLPGGHDAGLMQR
jgi:hypothetical protein